MYKHVNDARLVYKALNGVFLVYKPAHLHFNGMRTTIIKNLCKGYNASLLAPVILAGRTYDNMIYCF